MLTERPVVAMKWGDQAAQAQGAVMIGSEFAIGSRDTKGYIDRVSKLVRDPVTCARTGASMRARIEQHFSIAQTATHLEQLCEQLLQRRSITAVPETGAADQDNSQRIAAVA